MASTFETIVDAVVTAVAVDHTAGTGDYDLSGTDAVKIGRFHEPPVIPFVWIAEVGVESSTTSDGVGPVSLGTFGREFTLDIVGFVPGADNTPESRWRAATRLRDDIYQAIESDRTLGGLIKGMEIRSAAINGDEGDKAPGMGYCALEMTGWFRVVKGL